MPYVGDSITNVSEALQGFAGSFLQGSQVATQREVAQARIQALQMEQEAFQRSQQAQGEMMGMLQQRVEAPKIGQAMGVDAGLTGARTLLGLPIDPGYEPLAEKITREVQGRIQKAVEIGRNLSPQAAELFMRDQLGQIAEQSAKVRTGYFMERVSDLAAFGTGPGMSGLQIPNAGEYDARIKGLMEDVAKNGVTQDAERELRSIRTDLARDRGRLETRVTEAARLAELVMPLKQSLPMDAMRKVNAAVADHEAGLISYDEATKRIEAAEKGVPTPAELYMNASKMASAEVEASGGVLPEGQTFDTLIEKHLRRMTGQPEPQAQQWTPERVSQIAQAIKGRQLTKEQLQELNALPEPLKQAIEREVQGMQEPEPKKQKTPEEKLRDTAGTASNVQNAVMVGKTIADRVVKGAEKAAGAAKSAARGAIRPNEIDPVAVLQRKIQQAKDTIDRLKRNVKESEGRSKRISTLEKEIKQLEAELEKARG